MNFNNWAIRFQFKKSLKLRPQRFCAKINYVVKTLPKRNIVPVLNYAQGHDGIWEREGGGSSHS